MKIFDTIIIGKGLMGAAAAKYLSSRGQNIAVIGPDEPSDVSKATVYSSHYDQGRLQRIVGRDETWTRLNIESAKAYPQLQDETGIKFHHEPGCLYVSLHENDTYLKNLSAQAAAFQFPYSLFNSGEALHNAFPAFTFPSIAKGNFEAPPSGHINPRKLIEAQLAVCKKYHAAIISDTVIAISKGNDLMQVETQNGVTFYANKVLLAPGAFINFLQLIQRKLALRLKSETVLLAKVNGAELERLSTLPSLLYEIETKAFEEIYLIRPIQYPDGNWYLKMGCNLSTDIFFTSLDAVQQWFRYGDSDVNLPVLQNALLTIMPGLQVEEFFTKRCIITYTQHRKQYIGKITDGIYVATGGNGFSAMCSDAVGKIAAHVLLHDCFPESYHEKDFAPVFEDVKSQ
jgi:sarcosine oxidase